MGFNYCILFLYIYFVSTVQSSIPDEVLSRLKNSSTLSEVLNKINVKGSTNTSPPPPPFIDGVEVLQDSHQSKDSCKVVQVCTPVPIKKEVNVYYFPECIDLPQCLGSCCDNSHNCHPIQTTPVKVMVSSWKYVGYVNNEPTFEPSTQFLVDMQKHLSCDCTVCVKMPTCDASIQEPVGCQCICKSRATSSSCKGGNRQWSTETCSCQCIQTSCPQRQTFSQKDCMCVGPGGVTTTGIPDPVIDMGGNSRSSSIRSRNTRRRRFFRKAKTYRVLR